MLYGVTAFELKGKSALVEKDKNIRGKNQHSRGETLHYTDFALSLSLSLAPFSFYFNSVDVVHVRFISFSSHPLIQVHLKHTEEAPARLQTFTYGSRECSEH